MLRNNFQYISLLGSHFQEFIIIVTIIILIIINNYFFSLDNGQLIVVRTIVASLDILTF